MVILMQTTNLVRLSFIKSLLRDSGIQVNVFDYNISALEAGIGAFPVRIMIDERNWLAAKRILIDAGEFYDD